MTKHIIFAALLLACSTPVAAQDINPDRTVNPETLIEVRNVDPRVTADEDPALLLAQALVAEAGWTVQADHVAIPYVVTRRASLPAFRHAAKPENEVLLAYVSAFRCYGRPCDTERMGRMRSLTWPVLEARAPALSRLAKAWVRGDRPDDPCPAAWHWGSHQDGQNSPLPIVSCGQTSNLFLGKLPTAPAAPSVSESLGGAPISARRARGAHGRR